jgi:hypothetical protein
VASKFYAKIITRRLNAINEHVLSEEQCGFRKQRSRIFVMEPLIQKRREFNLPTYILFILRRRLRECPEVSCGM